MLASTTRRATASLYTASSSRSVSMWRVIVGSFKKEARQAVLNQPGLEQALIQRKILDELEKGKWLGKYWGPIVFRQKSSREYVNSLVTFEKIAAQASRPELKDLTNTSFRDKYSFNIPGLGSTLLPSPLARRLPAEIYSCLFTDPWRRQRIMKYTIDYLWEDLEQGIVETLVRSLSFTKLRGTRNPLVLSKYSKGFVNQWFGACLAYDHGTITSDAALADALWRNVYEADPTVPLAELLAFVEYVRKTQKAMAALSDETVLNADWQFLPLPFEIPEAEKVKLAKEPKLEHIPISRPTPTDPMAALLKQQYEAMKQRHEMQGQGNRGPVPSQPKPSESNAKSEKTL